MISDEELVVVMAIPLPTIPYRLPVQRLPPGKEVVPVSYGTVIVVQYSVLNCTVSYCIVLNLPCCTVLYCTVLVLLKTSVLRHSNDPEMVTSRILHPSDLPKNDGRLCTELLPRNVRLGDTFWLVPWLRTIAMAENSSFSHFKISSRHLSFDLRILQGASFSTKSKGILQHQNASL